MYKRFKALAAILHDGSVVTWGDREIGGQRGTGPAEECTEDSSF